MSKEILGSYLLDFYHVCDYLSAAAKAIVAETSGQQAWMDEQKTRLKTQRADELLHALHLHLEGADVNDSDAPVRQCHRYLSHRREQLDYQSALARDLPIGSGEIESAHRYIVQQRLKRPGAWWRSANAGLAAQSCEPSVGCVLGEGFKASSLIRISHQFESHPIAYAHSHEQTPYEIIKWPFPAMGRRRAHSLKRDAKGSPMLPTSPDHTQSTGTKHQCCLGLCWKGYNKLLYSICQHLCFLITPCLARGAYFAQGERNKS